MWNVLTTLFGDEQNLGERVADLITRLAKGWDLTAEDVETLDLAGRYATGWRPDQFMQSLIAASQTQQVDESETPEDADVDPDDGA